MPKPSNSKTLRKRAAEYNQQLVLHIALARKQDQVTAAIERQTEAGVRQAEKEAELYAYLSDIGAKLASGDFEFGRHNQNKGFYEWKQASEQLQSSLVNHFNEIMAGGDSLAEKARRVQQMFQPQVRYGDKIRMDDVSMRKINRMRSDVRELGGGGDRGGRSGFAGRSRGAELRRGVLAVADFGRGGCFHLCRWIKRCCGRRFDADTEEHRETQ